jgi:hypothetical protein
MEVLDSDVYRQEVWEQVKEVVAFVEQAVEARSAVHELERGLWERRLALGHRCLKLFFSLCGDGDEGAELCLPEGRVLQRLPERHARPYQSVFGPFELARVVYGTREGQKIEAVPLDERLRLPENKFSYLLQEWTQPSIVPWPYAQARALWAPILPGLPAVHSLERLHQAWAADVAPFWDAAPLPPAAPAGALVVCSADGKGAPIRGSEPIPAVERMHARGGPQPGRQKIAWGGSVYTVAPFVRTPEEVCKSLFDAPPTEASPARPKPQCKRLRASLLRDTEQSSQPAWDEVFGWRAQEVQSRVPQGHPPIVMVMDGQETLWEAGLKHLPEERFEVIEVLDLLHVTSRLWEAAHLFCPVGSARALEWMETAVGGVLRGKALSVVEDLRERGRDLPHPRLKTLERICGYFEKNNHRMAYDEYLAAGYPIASGIIEGACRCVVPDRMERSGMHWVLSGAHAMVSLRSVYLSDDLWNAFAQFHIEHDLRRLYPRIAANDDLLASLQVA